MVYLAIQKDCGLASAAAAANRTTTKDSRLESSGEKTPDTVEHCTFAEGCMFGACCTSAVGTVEHIPEFVVGAEVGQLEVAVAPT